MRIAYVVHNYPPDGIGGTEVYAWSLAHAMARQGHTVWVFVPGAQPGQNQDGQVRLWITARPTVDPLLGPAASFWFSFRNLAIERDWRVFLNAVQPDVVHFQHLQNVSARLPSLTPAPKVATLHDYWYLCPNGQFLRPDNSICAQPGTTLDCAMCGLAKAGLPPSRTLAVLASLPFGWRNRAVHQALMQMNRIVSPSEFLRQRYVERGVPGKRIVVMENGLDHARLAPSGELEPDQEAGLRLMFLGSIAWQKGVHVLIQAMNSLHHDTSLTIYGNMAQFPEYAAQLRAMAQHPRIAFAGPLDHRHVGDAMRQADYLVVPSLWYENSPVVIQEAHAVGLPVIASDLGALPEKVQDRITGRLFPAGDHQALARLIEQLAKDTSLRDGYRGNICPGPDVDAHATAMSDLYRHLLR